MPGRWILLLLLMPVLTQGLNSDHTEQEEQNEWQHYEYEYNYIEAMLVIGFVFIASFFEVSWHAVVRISRGSYKYGQNSYPKAALFAMEKPTKGNVKHRRLYEDLANRMGGEFMILGVLAFIIFVTDQANGFDSLAKRFHYDDAKDAWHMPRDGKDWLHMAELVHMKLFMGMVLYFILILCLVRGAIRQIKEWEKLHLRLCKQQHQEALHKESPNTPRLPLHVDKDLTKHVLWREYFMAKLLKWRETHPTLFSDILVNSDISEGDENQIRQQIHECFSLSEYFALNLEFGVVDSIQVHYQTWLGVMVTMGIFAILHRYARLELMHALPFFLILSFFLFICMFLCSRRQKREINKFVAARINRATSFVGDAPEAEPIKIDTPMSAPTESETIYDDNMSFSQRFSCEQLVLRLMQAFLFLISYIFARVLADFHAWRSQLLENTSLAAAFTVLFVIIAKFVPMLVPTFLAVMSFPPFVDPVNLGILKHVLLLEQDPAFKLRSSRGSDSISKVGSFTNTCPTGNRDSERFVAAELAEILGVRAEFEERMWRKQNATCNLSEHI